MNVQISQPMRLPLPLLIGGLVALVFSTAAMTYASVADWASVLPRAAPGNSVQANLSDVSEAQVDAETRCRECGVIESVRRATPISSPIAMYEIRVRLGDGSTRVVHDPSPAAWRPGERMILIGGRDHTER